MRFKFIHKCKVELQAMSAPTAESWFEQETGRKVAGYAEFQAYDGSSRIVDDRGDRWTVKRNFQKQLWPKPPGDPAPFVIVAGWR